MILFAHGARDPRWAEPLYRLRERLGKALPGVPVVIAFLEFSEPDLPRAATELLAAGCGSLCIVPIFLGQGGHVRRDLAALVDALAARHPGVDIHCAGAAGEDDAVQDALAAYCVAAFAPPARPVGHGAEGSR